MVRPPDYWQLTQVIDPDSGAIGESRAWLAGIPTTWQVVRRLLKDCCYWQFAPYRPQKIYRSASRHTFGGVGDLGSSGEVGAMDWALDSIVTITAPAHDYESGKMPAPKPSLFGDSGDEGFGMLDGGSLRCFAARSGDLAAAGVPGGTCREAGAGWPWGWSYRTGRGREPSAYSSSKSSYRET